MKTKDTDKQRKLTNPKSEMTKMKQLWRKSFSDEERDYWREQLDSPRPFSELRQELLDKYHINLPHDNQFRRLKSWAADFDRQKEEAEQAEADRIELEQQGLSGSQLRDELLERMKRRAFNSGNFKLGAEAIKLDLAADRIALTDRSVTVQEKRLAHLEKAIEDAAQPGGLTPEVLEKIERELKLM